MAWTSVLLALALGFGAFAGEEHCAIRELQRQDCLLKDKNFQVQISKMKITWNDGTWTSITDMPMTDDGFEWNRIELDRFADARWILQMSIWDKGKGEAKVQSLHWLVGEMKEKSFTKYLDQIVRRREVHSTNPVTYSYDKLTPHGLTFLNKTLRWHAGKQNGTL